VLPQLTGPAAARGGLVSLTSSNSSLAPLPKSVLIPAGSYSSADLVAPPEADFELAADLAGRELGESDPSAAT